MLNLITDANNHSDSLNNLDEVVQSRDNDFRFGKSTSDKVVTLLNRKCALTLKNHSEKTILFGKDNTAKKRTFNNEAMLPISIILIEINNYEQISSIFSKTTIQKTHEIIIGSLLRSLDRTNESLVDHENGLYVALLQKTSISSITRTVDNFLKNIKNLTIPYPKKAIYSVLNVNIGIAYFTDLSEDQAGSNLFDVAAAALKQSKIWGRVVMNTNLEKSNMIQF